MRLSEKDIKDEIVFVPYFEVRIPFIDLFWCINHEKLINGNINSILFLK